jgi:TetR/AcrR family transcriptional regulator
MEKDKGPGSRERILESAVQLFAKKGYSSTGVRELAEKAGVNLAMVNYFFGSKKELLKVILDTFFSGYLKIMERELATDRTVEQKIGCFIEQAVAYISENKEYMIVTLTELPHDDPEIIDYKASWARRAIKVICENICTPLYEESGRQLPPILFGPVLISMMSSRFLFAPVMEQVSLPEYREDFFEMYPDILKELFLNGVNGLTKGEREEEE